jgi:hypothetical protein
MRLAGVDFRPSNGTARPDPVTVDFARLIRRDTLLNKPPSNLKAGLGIIRWADELVDLVKRTLTFRM